MTVEERILLLALRGRDAQIVEQLLSRQGHACHICRSVDALAHELAQGAGAALVTEESLAETDRANLSGWLEAQPPWSDFPFILLATKRTGRRTKEASGILHQLGNVVVLERPIHGETLASAAASALRARRRQYDARSHLRELEAAEETLTQLNGSLETRIEPPWASITACTTARPRPVPSRSLSVVKKRSKILGRLAGEMPGP